MFVVEPTVEIPTHVVEAYQEQGDGQAQGDTSPSPSGSPVNQKKHAVVAAKADYFFGQATKLHDEFAAIERRSGARKLS